MVKAQSVLLESYEKAHKHEEKDAHNHDDPEQVGKNVDHINFSQISISDGLNRVWRGLANRESRTVGEISFLPSGKKDKWMPAALSRPS